MAFRSFKVDRDTLQERKALHNKWSSDHTRVLHLISEGFSAAQISRDTKMSIDRVKRITYHKEFKNKLKEIEARVIDQIVETKADINDLKTVQEAIKLLTDKALDAAHVLIELAMDNEPRSRVQLEACKELLDRAGVRVPEIVTSRTFEKAYSPAEVVHAKQIMEESQAILERLATSTSPFVISSLIETSVFKEVPGGIDESSSAVPAVQDRPAHVPAQPLLPV